MRIANLLAGWTSGVLIVIFALSGTIGVFSTFVPSRLTVLMTIYSASVIGLFYTAMFWGIGDFGWKSMSNSKVAKLPEQPYLRGPLMGLGMFCLAWMSLGNGLPGMLTLVIGNNGVMNAVVDGWHIQTGRSCLHPTLEHVPPFMMNEHTLCTAKGREAAMPPGTTVQIVGKASLLGVFPTGIQQ
jgi:hypothetical protein